MWPQDGHHNRFPLTCSWMQHIKRDNFASEANSEFVFDGLKSFPHFFPNSSRPWNYKLFNSIIEKDQNSKYFLLYIPWMFQYIIKKTQWQSLPFQCDILQMFFQKPPLPKICKTDFWWGFVHNIIPYMIDHQENVTNTFTFIAALKRSP